MVLIAAAQNGPQVSKSSMRRRLTRYSLERYFVAAAPLVFVAALGWIGALRHAPRQPWLYTLMAAVAGAAFAWRLVRVRKRVRLLKLGRDGELVVGQFLEGLRVSGARVFHDIPGEGFNLDHAVFATHGCYVIETKTRRKPVRGEARVTLSEEWCVHFRAAAGPESCRAGACRRRVAREIPRGEYR